MEMDLTYPTLFREQPSMQALPGSSPISGVPTDVLLRIFHIGTHCSSDDTDMVNFPIAVSHVCQTWRGTAVLTPTLWTTVIVTTFTPPSLHLPPYDPYGFSTEALSIAFPLLHMFLTRSGCLPLTVCLDLRSPSPNLALSDFAVEHDFPSSLIIILLDILLPYSARFKEFSLLSDVWPTILFTLHKFQRVHMPLLEKWDIVRCNMYHCFNEDFKPRQLKNPVALLCGAEEQFGSAQGLSKYPRLKSMILSGTHVDWSCWSVRNLTSLTINYLAKEVRPSFSMLHNILLASASTLTYFEIQGAAPVSTTEGSSSPLSESIIASISLPALVELVIGYTTPAEVMPLMLAIHAPQLKTLKLFDIDRLLYPDLLTEVTPHADNDATPLFEALLECMCYPLNSIEHLTLGSVGFCVPTNAAAIIGNATDGVFWDVDPEVLTPLRLLLSLSGLKSLTLDQPDTAILFALNTPIPDPLANVKADNTIMMPAPRSLTHLTITHSPHLTEFLRTRAMSKFCAEPSSLAIGVWEELMVGMNGGAPALYGVSVGEEWDLHCLAKRVKVLDETILVPERVNDYVDMEVVEAYIEQWGDPVA